MSCDRRQVAGATLFPSPLSDRIRALISPENSQPFSIFNVQGLSTDSPPLTAFLIVSSLKIFSRFFGVKNSICSYWRLLRLDGLIHCRKKFMRGREG